MESMTQLTTPDWRAKALQFLQLFIFLIIIILTQYKQFTLAFTIIIGFVIFMTVTSKQNRVFIWVITAYILGYLFYLYGDRFIEELPFPISIIMIINRCLLFFPIIFMVYVIKKFDVVLNHYWDKPNWKATISFPFIWSGFHSVSVKVFLMIAICINFAVFIPFIHFSNIQLASPSFLFFLFIFSFVNAILEEILWRGILLTRMSTLAGEKAAVIFSGITFGISHISLGFSWDVCLLFALGGIFYAGITVRSGSILPAIIWHIMFNFLMILSGIIPYID
ncbi:CPBP family intramembrane metalloprotease [Bacillus sp. FJAT-49705]|uniref:CPBP family intramembrane metalloprotease n=1 Tax=Cytobacillus citreus TaxID=2833586 RepID=A0ABS5NPN7_9BACI|nr:type II CAAX endopeptidase family protein [Cytobacillus citreus]MBS4189419.1 CPBP family intramembrane metalloprotease [Cytobacillus citreus]